MIPIPRFSRYLVGQDIGYPTASFSSWTIGTHDVRGTHKTVARVIAQNGIVLLKNTNNALPLKKPASLAIIGSGAIQNPHGINSCADCQCDTRRLAMLWGSGTAEFLYLMASLDAIKTQASADGTTL
jgi:beta-glucosidase